MERQEREITIERIGSESRAALSAMVDESLTELHRHRERPIGPRTAQEYRYLPFYWSEPGRHPFFIRSADQRVGFALVREVAGLGRIQMSDFYIRPDARRTGFGRRAVAALWRRFPGAWELQVHPKNAAATAFWPRCIALASTGEVVVKTVEEADGLRTQYHFEIPPAPGS